MQLLIRLLDRSLTCILVMLVITMVLTITGEIVLREVFQPVYRYLTGNAPEFLSQISGPINTASQTQLVWLGILGSALALRYRAHVGVDALVMQYPVRWQKRLAIVSDVLVAVFSLVVLLVGGTMVCQQAIAIDSRMPGFESLNRAWFYAVLPITGLLSLIYIAYLLGWGDERKNISSPSSTPSPPTTPPGEAKQ